MELVKKFIEFVKEAYSELRKVAWLSRKELVATTAIIVVFIVLSAVYVGLVDFVLSKILSVFLIR